MLAACSIYPLPEDAIGFNSEAISIVVRCQARDSIRQLIVDNVAQMSGVVYNGMNSSQMIDWLNADNNNFRTIDWDKFTPFLRNNFKFYKDTMISYDFTIDTTETNGNGFDLSLMKNFTRGLNKVGIVAKNDRSREVKRHFRLYDTFEGLAIKLPEKYCYDVPTQKNYLYPSAGLLRIGSLINQFVRQNDIGNLGQDKDYKTAEMTDTITFSTKFTGNFDPTFQVNAIHRTYVPSQLSVNVDNSRQDLHTIIVSILLPSDRKTLPQTDEFGRIISEQQGRQAEAANSLNRARDFNQQDAIIKLGTDFSRLSP